MTTTQEQHSFERDGWAVFAFDQQIADWVAHATPAALSAIHAPENADWLRCGGTWFAGVNVLENDASGAIIGSGALTGAVVDFLRTRNLPTDNWDKAQISVIYPGYPQPGAQEIEQAFNYRLNRDAAHVDGLLPTGPDRRRVIGEPHAFVLGLPLNRTSADASPMVIWKGSHNLMRAALIDALRGHPETDWPETDVTEAYHAARRHVFKTCERVEIHAEPEQAYIIDRHTLHGVAPWGPNAIAPPEGRIIAYFCFECPGGIREWLKHRP